MEAIFILPTAASVEAFKAFDADLDRIANPDDQVFAYGVDNKEAFEAPLAGEMKSRSSAVAYRYANLTCVVLHCTSVRHALASWFQSADWSEARCANCS